MRTYFTSDYMIYTFTRMLFKLQNADISLHYVMYIVLSSVKWQLPLSYLDDILLLLQKLHQQRDHTRLDSSILREAFVTTKLQKLAFFTDKLDCPVNFICLDRLEVADHRTDNQHVRNTSRTQAEICLFLTFCKLFCRFFRVFATVKTSPTAMLRKKQENFRITHQNSYLIRPLQQMLTSPPEPALAKKEER